MKTRLLRISPGDMGLLLGFFGFILSIPTMIFAFVAIGPGRTVNLNGFMCYTFTDSIQPIWIVFAYPFFNALGGVIGGFLIGWLYNLYARHFEGVSIDLEQVEKLPEKPLSDYLSQSCTRCGYTIEKGVFRCPNCGAERS